MQHHDLKAISTLARDTLVLVPLGLPFFVPIALAPRLGLGFWPALLGGILLASIIGALDAICAPQLSCGVWQPVAMIRGTTGVESTQAVLRPLQLDEGFTFESEPAATGSGVELGGEV